MVSGSSKASLVRSGDRSLRTRIAGALLPRLGLLQRGMTFGVRGLVVDADGRVCLVRHTYVPGWYLPGGGVDPGESAAQAVARELREEAAISMSGAPRLFHLYRNTVGAGRDHVALYVVRDFTLGACGVDDKEIAEIGFFARSNLPRETTAATLARLGEVFDGAAVSETW